MELEFIPFEENKIEDQNKYNYELENPSHLNEELEEPKVGMKFNFEEEVIVYYANFAKKKGFGVLKRSSKIGEDGKKYFTITCSSSGKSRSRRRNLLKPNPIIKT